MARSQKDKPPLETVRFHGRVEAIGADGDGIVRHDGRVVFAPLTAPGDEGEFEASGDRGRLVALRAPGLARRVAPCPNYGACGGCALQHIDAAFYHEVKRQRVVDALTQVGLDGSIVGPLVITPPATRRRAVFGVDWHAQGPRLGFKERRSIRIAPIAGCLILDPRLAAAVGPLAGIASALSPTKLDIAVTLCENGLDVDIRAPRLDAVPHDAWPALQAAMTAAGVVRLSMNGEPALTLDPPMVDISGVRVTPPPGGFLQASREGEGALVALAQRALEGRRRIIDLFSGCGTFSLPLALMARVCAADADAGALGALSLALAQAQRLGARPRPIEILHRNLFIRPLTAPELERFDAALFDPPRAGAIQQARELARSTLEVIVGVSCNPVTFARDAAILSQGGYRLHTVTPVDQFVYTAHVELVGVFKRD